MERVPGEPLSRRRGKVAWRDLVPLIEDDRAILEVALERAAHLDLCRFSRRHRSVSLAADENAPTFGLFRPGDGAT